MELLLQKSKTLDLKKRHLEIYASYNTEEDAEGSRKKGFENNCSIKLQAESLIQILGKYIEV